MVYYQYTTWFCLHIHQFNLKVSLRLVYFCCRQSKHFTFRTFEMIQFPNSHRFKIPFSPVETFRFYRLYTFKI